MKNSDFSSFQLKQDSFNLFDSCLGHFGSVQLMHCSLLEIYTQALNSKDY
jgi:hypothetical protein